VRCCSWLYLRDRKYSMRISVSALTLRGGKSPGGAHDVEAALRRRMIAERETLFLGMPVWALLTATPSRHLISEKYAPILH
jgi:hypothetical protein